MKSSDVYVSTYLHKTLLVALASDCSSSNSDANGFSVARRMLYDCVCFKSDLA